MFLLCRRIFLWPSIILILLGALTIAFNGGNAIPTTGAWQAWPGGREFEPSVARVFWLGICLAADALAVGWFGMYLALTLRRPILAPALTIVLVLILPSLLSWLALVVDVLFISWGTTRLQEDFRQILIRRYQGEPAPSQIGGESAPELAPALT